MEKDIKLFIVKLLKQYDEDCNRITQDRLYEALAKNYYDQLYCKVVQRERLNEETICHGCHYPKSECICFIDNLSND